MAATIFDSKLLVARMTAELQNEAAQFRKQHHRSARLAQIIAGHDGAAEVYSRQLVRACGKIGLGCATLAYPFEVEEEELRAEVATLSKDENNDGVLLLLPLPSHIRQQVVTEVLLPEKDVDGLGPRNAGNLLLGFSVRQKGQFFAASVLRAPKQDNALRGDRGHRWFNRLHGALPVACATMHSGHRS